MHGNSIDDSFLNLKKVLIKAGISQDSFTFLLADEQNNQVIAHNVNNPFNPASIMKLITTSAALDLLGPNFKWETKLLLSEIPKENYTGNIYIKGSGDPFFLIEDLRNLLRILKVLGIKNISGDFVLDNSTFTLKKFDRGKFDGKPLEPYNVGPDALLLNFFSSEAVFSSSPTSKIKLDIFPPPKKISKLDCNLLIKHVNIQKLTQKNILILSSSLVILENVVI